MQVAGVVVGEGFRFGYRAAGNTDSLRSIGKDLGLVVNVVDLIKLSATRNESPVSSSKVSCSSSLATPQLRTTLALGAGSHMPLCWKACGSTSSTQWNAKLWTSL